MKYPLVVFEKECDMLAFKDVKKAESYLELVDVKNNEYSAFDAEGRKLVFKIDKNKFHIEETALVQQEVLKGKLIEFIARAKKIERTKLTELPLEKLIQLGNNG